ncbi:uncharacterized protein METZ01_LOCUS506341 [marine metagenome]|jgi:hypothetical protein|uniref:Uncharacterized protein n=1 Tax=marine metagenome TaxID=408172 RepID=A0A383E9H1_9ZZZZ
MNIENPKWMTDEKLGLTVTIDGTNMAVPKDENNIQYAAILEWVAAGNTIAEPD